jgi:hypothetical protein
MLRDLRIGDAAVGPLQQEISKALGTHPVSSFGGPGVVRLSPA